MVLLQCCYHYQGYREIPWKFTWRKLCSATVYSPSVKPASRAQPA